MPRDAVEQQTPVDVKPTLARRHAAPRALWFISIPVVLMVVLAVVSFDGDWTYIALAGAMVLVVLGMVYVERRRSERLLPPGYRGLLAEIIEGGGGSGAPSGNGARAAVDRLVRLQEEMDAINDRRAQEIHGLDPRLAAWAGTLGAVLWLVAAVAALVVDELRAAVICVLMAAFFAGLAWFTQSERKRRQGTVAMLEARISQARAKVGDRR